MHGLLTETSTANALGVKPATLRRWRWAGKGLPFIKIGSLVKYAQKDVEAYIENNRRANTSNKGGRNE